MKNQEMNVFELCLRDHKISTFEMFAWFDIELEYGCGEFGGRYFRIIGHDDDIVEFSCPTEDFDRWANSRSEDEELVFHLTRPSERRAFIRYIEYISNSQKDLELVV